MAPCIHLFASWLQELGQIPWANQASIHPIHFAQGTTQLPGGPAGNEFNAFASFLMGLPQESGRISLFNQIRVPADQAEEFTIREKSFSAYLRDRWQVSHKLTVSYGLRADYFKFPRRAGTGVEFYNAQNNTMVVCGVGSTPKDCLSSHRAPSYIELMESL